MTFHNAEKARYNSLKREMFLAEACQPRPYTNISRGSCLADQARG